MSGREQDGSVIQSLPAEVYEQLAQLDDTRAGSMLSTVLALIVMQWALLAAALNFGEWRAVRAAAYWLRAEGVQRDQVNRLMNEIPADIRRGSRYDLKTQRVRNHYGAEWRRAWREVCDANEGREHV